MERLPLTLIHAKTIFEGSTGDPSYLVIGTTSGYIDVANIAPFKSVVVHYSNNGTSWTTADAAYLMSTCDNREIWRFSFPNQTKGYRATLSTQLAVKYEAGGQVYWDNNDWHNYRTGSGGYSEPEEVVLRENNVIVDSFQIVDGTFRGRIFVRNLAPNKIVKVRYTSDNWTTFCDIDAQFSAVNGEHDSWTFSTPMDTNAKIHFAVSYCVSGHTYWDNNFGQNYYAAAN